MKLGSENKTCQFSFALMQVPLELTHHPNVSKRELAFEQEFKGSDVLDRHNVEVVFVLRSSSALRQPNTRHI
jgi:hypothetical protein